MLDGAVLCATAADALAPTENLDLPQHDAGSEVDTEPPAKTGDPSAAPTADDFGEDDPCTHDIAPTSQLRRLTRQQYDATIHDLLGVTTLSTQGNTAPSELLGKDHLEALTDRDWAGYRAAARAIAFEVMSEPALVPNFAACDLATGESCLRETISKFGRRAFRRPLTSLERESFARLLDAEPDAAAEEVAGVLLETFLLSPSFLQRAEGTGTTQADGSVSLSSHELAARLSYMLWGTTPDPELDALADADELLSSEQILAQARHMLEDPRAALMVTKFNRAYLGMGLGSDWERAPKDPEAFPEFNSELLPSLAAESEQFLGQVILGGGSFADLFQSETVFVNKQLAPLYGLQAAGFDRDELTAVDVEGRPGFLTRVGFLNAYAMYDRSSPVRRGAWILKNVLGVDVGSPPPEAAKEPLGALTEDLDTNRKAVESRTSPAECLQCHSLINPLGFVFEGFNAIGMSQTSETSGAAIDTVADVSLDGATVTVATPKELMALLVASPSVRGHYARAWVNSAYERAADANADACIVDQLSPRLNEDGYSLLDLIADLTLTPQFRRRTVEISP